MSTDLKTQLRSYFEDFDVSLPAVSPQEAGRSEHRPQPPGRRLLFRWAIAAAAAIVVLVTITAAALLLRDSEPELIDEPTPTSQVPPPSTSVPPPTSLPLGPVATPTYGDVPSFTGTVWYFDHDRPAGELGWEATVEVRFAGPMEYEIEVTSQSDWDPRLQGPGALYTADGESLWLQGPAGETPVFYGDVDIWRHLFFDSAAPSPEWPAICGDTPETVGSELLLGRVTRRVMCGSQELWIDEESGLVLKMSGSLLFSPSGSDSVGFEPWIERQGGFEFTELVFAAVSAPEFPIPSSEWQRGAVTWTDDTGFEYRGPSEIRDLAVPAPFELTIQRDATSHQAFLGVVEIARGWAYEEFLEYVSIAGVSLVDLGQAQLPDWVTFAGTATLNPGESSAAIRIPWLDSGIVYLFGSYGSGADLRIDSSDASTVAAIEVHIGETGSEGSFAGAACGFAPQDLPDRTLRVTRSPISDGTGYEYSYAGPDVLRAGEAVFLHRITDFDNPHSVAALIGLADGYTWEDVVLFGEEQNLKLRNGGKWQRPDWMVFDAALATGCGDGFVAGAAVNLPPGSYFVAADMSPGIHEITPDQLVATLQVTP